MAEASPSTSSEPSEAISCANRIAKAEEFKQSGNVFFKEKNYKKAIGKYHRGLLQVRDVERKGGDLLQSFMGFTNQGGSVTKPRDSQLTEEMAKQIKLLELSFYNNLAACLLHDDKPNYKRVMEYCDEVLSRDSENPKAWYRKGVALYHIQEYAEALTCLNKAKESMPRDGEIRRYLHLCEEGNAKQLQEEKLRYQGLFKKMAESDVDG